MINPKSKIPNPKQIPNPKSKKRNKIIFIVGPTAIGKSKIAVFLAKKINTEIISCDSMQIYQGMDIVTSKASPELRKKIPHHLLGVIDPAKEYNVSRYRRDALRKIKDIFKKGKIPLFVGGTGLYMSILLDGIFKAKAQDECLRSKLYAQAKAQGSLYLYNKLRAVDPVAAGKIHPNDTRRIVRALEVFSCCGKPISQLQRQRDGLADKYDVRIFCLDMPRAELYQKIDRRVEEMFTSGLMREVKKLLKLKLSRTASFAIGIKELKGYFEGAYDLEEAKRLLKKNTRNYAKRQLTWFRKDKRIEWLGIREKDSPACIARRVHKQFLDKNA